MPLHNEPTGARWQAANYASEAHPGARQNPAEVAAAELGFTDLTWQHT
jgi:hypothetical protein